jgi:hypothetical protein
MDSQENGSQVPAVNENKSWTDYIRENKTMVIIIIILIVIAVWYFAFRKPSTVSVAPKPGSIGVDSSALPPVGNSVPSGTIHVTKI